jgi:hypothetical protein
LLLILFFHIIKNNQKPAAKNEFEIPDRFDLIHLVKMSKRIKKPFHGKYFISYLRKNPLEHQNG